MSTIKNEKTILLNGIEYPVDYLAAAIQNFDAALFPSTMKDVPQKIKDTPSKENYTSSVLQSIIDKENTDSKESHLIEDDNTKTSSKSPEHVSPESVRKMQRIFHGAEISDITSSETVETTDTNLELVFDNSKITDIPETVEPTEIFVPQSEIEMKQDIIEEDEDDDPFFFKRDAAEEILHDSKNGILAAIIESATQPVKDDISENMEISIIEEKIVNEVAVVETLAVATDEAQENIIEEDNDSTNVTLDNEPELLSVIPDAEVVELTTDETDNIDEIIEGFNKEVAEDNNIRINLKSNDDSLEIEILSILKEEKHEPVMQVEDTETNETDDGNIIMNVDPVTHDELPSMPVPAFLLNDIHNRQMETQKEPIDILEETEHKKITDMNLETNEKIKNIDEIESKIDHYALYKTEYPVTGIISKDEIKKAWVLKLNTEIDGEVVSIEHTQPLTYTAKEALSLPTHYHAISFMGDMTNHCVDLDELKVPSTQNATKLFTQPTHTPNADREEILILQKKNTILAEELESIKNHMGKDWMTVYNALIQSEKHKSILKNRLLEADVINDLIGEKNVKNKE